MPLDTQIVASGCRQPRDSATVVLSCIPETGIEITLENSQRVDLAFIRGEVQALGNEEGGVPAPDEGRQALLREQPCGACATEVALSRPLDERYEPTALQNVMFLEFGWNDVDASLSKTCELLRHGLHLVAAKILVTEILEPFAQFLALDLLVDRVRHLRVLEHGIVDEDGAVEPQRERERIARP